MLYEKGLAMLGEADAPARLDALHNLGDVLEQSGKTDEAAECFAEMLQVAWRYDSLNKAGAAYSRLARGQRRLGKYDAAMGHLRRAQELFERSRDDRGIASTLDDMGRVHWLRGAYGQALDFHRQALTIRRALGDRRSIALSFANIGRVHHDTGNFKAAINQFREALDLRRDIGDLEVGRVLPYQGGRMVGPFIFFDHIGPVGFAAGLPRSVDVRPHPHIGLATLTYLFAGEIMHRDSVGSEQPIVPGEVNWMTAGRGITHSERFEAARRNGGAAASSATGNLR